MGIPANAGVSASGLPPTGDRANAVVSGTFTAVGPGKPFAVRGPMNMMAWGVFKTSLTTTAGSTSASVVSGTNMATGQTVNSVNVPPGTTWLTFSGTSGTLAFAPQTWYGVLTAGVAQITMAVNASGATLPANLATLVGATISSTYFGSGVTVSGVGATLGTLLLSAAPTSLPTNGGSVPIEFAVTGNAILTTGADAAATFTGAALIFNTATTLQVERSIDGGQSYVVCNIGGGGTLAQYTGTGFPISLTFGEPELGVLYRWNCTVFSAQTGVTLNYRISTTGEAATTLAVGTVI